MQCCQILILIIESEMFVKRIQSFLFTNKVASSAAKAKARWPDMTGGTFIENNLAPNKLNNDISWQSVPWKKVASGGSTIRPRHAQTIIDLQFALIGGLQRIVLPNNQNNGRLFCQFLHFFFQPSQALSQRIRIVSFDFAVVHRFSVPEVKDVRDRWNYFLQMVCDID